MKRLSLGLAFCGFVPLLLAVSATPAPAQAGQSPPQATLVSEEKLGTAREIAGVIFSVNDPQALDRMAASLTAGMMTPKSLAMQQIASTLVGTGVSLPKEALSEDGALAAMRFLDPAFDQRAGIIGAVMGQKVGAVLTANSEKLREALAKVLASRFSQQQLVDLRVFFRSPTGRVYARESLSLPTDPAYMAVMLEVGAQARAAMPTIFAELEERMANLPQPRRVRDLSEADQAKFAQLLASRGGGS